MLAELIVRGFHRNQRVIAAQAEGLSDADALRQSGYNTNCFNWVVGHIVVSRDDLLRTLGGAPVLGPAGDRYHRESEPVRGPGPGVVPLSQLLPALEETGAGLEQALAALDAAALAEETPVDGGRTATRGAQIMFTYFHDTYHTGQTDVIRQLSGKSDKII